MSNLVSQEQARINNKISEISEDIRFKYPNPSEKESTTGFMSLGEITIPETPKIDLQTETVDPNLLYKTLGSGERIAKFDSYITGIGEEQRLAEQQTKANKWGNGLSKFLGKTGTAVLGGTVGSLYGIFDAVKEGSFQNIWNNDFNNYLDDLNTKMDYNLPNYYTEQEKSEGFIGSLDNANFWANDFLGGLSFTVGTVVSEGIWAAATGGTSLVTSAARVGLRGANKIGKAARTFDNIKDTSKAIKDATRVTKDFIKKSALDTKRATNYGKAAQVLNTTRFTYTSAGYEAGFEARQYLKEQKENFERDFETLNGRKPTEQDRLEFNQGLDSSANTLFAANLALVGGSNLAILGKMYNISSPIKAPKKWANKKLFGVGVNKTSEGTFESIKRTTTQKVLGTSYSIFKAPFIEGFIEEGGQATFATSAESFLEAQYNNQKESIDLIEAMYEGLSETYGTKEGWKEVGLGMLIGLVGGQGSNALSGQGLFSDVSNLKKRDQLEAESRNKYGAEKLISEISKNAVITKANQEAQKASERGDLTGEALANDMAMLANIMNAEKFDYSKDSKEELFTLVDLIDNETISEQYGVSTEEEIQEIKNEIKTKYSSLQDSYVKNRNFVDYQIGQQQLPDDQGISVESIKDAIAYQMTIAESAENLTEDYLEEIKREVLTFTSEAANFTQALDLQNALLKTSTAKKKEYYNLKNRYNRVLKKIDLAEKKTRSLENQILVREEAQEYAKELDINNRRIQELQLQLEEVRSDINLLTEGILVSSPFVADNPIVRTNDILDIDESLENLQKELDIVRKKDPSKAAKLEKLTKEYKKSINITSNYGRIIDGLLNPELGLRGDSRTFFKKRKPLNEATLDFLLDIQQAKQDYKEIERRFENQESETEENSNGDDINTTEQTETEVSLNPVETLKSKLASLMKDNSYLLEYFGDDVLEQRPTIQDLNEFQNLKDKYQDSNIDILINVDPTRLSNTARGGLSLEEITRYQELAEKLANWRLLDGVESEGVSVLDIINQIEALQSNVEQVNITDQTSVKEDIEIALQSKSIDKNESADPAITQSYDTVLVLQKPSHIEITHMNLSLFIERGAVIKENGKPVSNIEKLQKNRKRSFTIEFGETVIPARIVEHGRIRIEQDKVQDLLDKTNTKIVDVSLLKDRSWSSMYEETEPGVYKPIKTDYIVDPSDSGFSVMSPEEVYNMQQGEPIFFKVSLNDSWNRGFESELDNLNLNDQKQVENFKRKLRNQVQVYVVNQENQVSSVLKAANTKSSNQEFLMIRNKAAEIVYESYLTKNFDKTVFDLPFSIPVESVYVGMPNMTLVENNGKLIPKKTPFTEDTLKLVEGYGIANNGGVTQNPNNPIDNALINTQFIQNLEGNRPVAIIRYNKQLIAYPITLEKRDSNLLDQVVGILNTQDTNSNKVVEISKVLAQNGIDPKQYNLVQSGDISFIGSQDQNRLLNDLENIKTPISSEEFLDLSFTKDRLISSGSITIDLTDKPFRNPKLKMNYSSISPLTQKVSTEEDIFNRTGKVLPSVLNSVVNKIIKKQNLSEFENKVLSLQPELVNEEVESRLRLSEEKENQSKKERNKKC